MLLKRTRDGSLIACSDHAERVSQWNKKVSFTLWGRKYEFEANEYSIRLLDDGRIIDEVSGVYLEHRKRGACGCGWILGACGCGCCVGIAGVAGAVIGAIIMFLIVYYYFAAMFLRHWL